VRLVARDRFRFVFYLPARLKEDIANGDLDKVVRAYKNSQVRDTHARVPLLSLGLHTGPILEWCRPRTSLQEANEFDKIGGGTGLLIGRRIRTTIRLALICPALVFASEVGGAQFPKGCYIAATLSHFPSPRRLNHLV